MEDTADSFRASGNRLVTISLLLRSHRKLKNQATAIQIEILNAIRVRRSVNKVSVYRILDDLTRLGLVRKLPSEGAAAHYELACEHHPPHPHFQCQACGEVQCLEPVPLERIWREIDPRGNRAERLEIRVEGLCRRCQGKDGS